MSNNILLQESFNTLKQANISESLVSIKVRPTKATCSKPKDRAKLSTNVTLGAMNTRTLSNATEQHNDKYKFQYMVTIKGSSLSDWLMYDSFTKYLALQNLQVVENTYEVNKDGSVTEVPVEYESYTSSRDNKTELLTFYVVASADVVGELQQ